MPKSWYLGARGGTTTTGPLTEEEIRDLISDGAISADSLVWRVGTTDWVEASEAFDAFDPPPLPIEYDPPPLPTEYDVRPKVDNSSATPSNQESNSREEKPVEESSEDSSVKAEEPPQLPSLNTELGKRSTARVSTAEQNQSKRRSKTLPL